MLINTALTREGEFYMMEGVPWDWPFGALTGTIDQRLASHPYSYMLFPSLDKNELIGFFKLTKNGKVLHGNGHADIALGTKDIPYGEPIKFFNRTSHWVDLPQSFILQIGKHIIQSWDIDLLKRVWQKIPDMMNYLDETLVNDVPEGITTYDYKKYQPCFIYTAVLHLATLRMAIYLAELLKNVMEKEDPKKVEDLKNFITNYKKQYRATNQSYQDRLWIPQGGENTPEGFFKTCERGYTVFTSALAGDWISRFCGLGPVVDYNKAYSHSEWQSKALVNSHDISIIGDKRTRPLIYREADIEGNEIPVRVILKKKFHVNNPWQTLAYQAFEAIYLNRLEESLEIIKKIWEKGYYEGFPWDLDHWGQKGHIYMTHPVMWAVLNALTGASYNGFEDHLIISPRFIPRIEKMSIPLFFPDFWLLMEYDQSSNEIKFTVIKSFRSDLMIKRIIHQTADGTERVYPLPNKIKIEKNVKFSVEIKL
jgi:uncharacterized protein (DUF608 family)